MEIIKQFGKITLNDNIFIDSKIINKDKDQQTSIINWIKQKTNKNMVKFEKIFTMSLNGDLSKDFQIFYDNKGQTLIIIITTKNNNFWRVYSAKLGK